MPDPWVPLRTLNYCLQVWLRWRSQHGSEPGLPLIVPLVLYQGQEPWQYERELAALFADREPAWRWVTRFEHLLVDQTRHRPESVPGALPARLAQVAMMAAFRDAREELLESVTRMMGELYRAAGFEEVAKHVEYVLATQPDEYRPLFVRALRRNVPGRGRDVMNYFEQLIERGRREDLEDGLKERRQEGELTGAPRGSVRRRTERASTSCAPPRREDLAQVLPELARTPDPAATRPPLLLPRCRVKPRRLAAGELVTFAGRRCSQ